jgi:hypothetical protein
MKPLGTLAVAAVSGVVLWQVFATLLLPLLGIVIGLVVTAAKIALVVALGFFVYSMIKKRRAQARA